MINELKAKAETAEKMCLATGGNKNLYIEEIKKCYASIADVRNQMTELKAQIDKSPEYKNELEKIDACISDEEKCLPNPPFCAIIITVIRKG